MFKSHDVTNERLLQEMIDGSPSMIFLKDIEGRFVVINKILERLLGITRDELKGKTDYDLFPKEAADRYREYDRQVIETGRAIQVEEVATLQGREFVFLANKFPLHDEQGNIYAVCGISHDITERKRAAAAVKEAERLAAMGKLVSDLAHELNNPLQAAVSAVFVTQGEPGLSEEGVQRLRMAAAEIMKAAELAARTMRAATNALPDSKFQHSKAVRQMKIDE